MGNSNHVRNGSFDQCVEKKRGMAQTLVLYQLMWIAPSSYDLIFGEKTHEMDMKWGQQASLRH
jgi:hypothetical protein